MLGLLDLFLFSPFRLLVFVYLALSPTAQCHAGATKDDDDKGSFELGVSLDTTSLVTSTDLVARPA